MAMRFSIAQVLAMLENDDINGDEDVPMMPGSDDEFGSEGSGDELLDDMGEEDVHTTSEVCAGEEGEQNGSEDEFHHQNYFDDMGEENVQTTSEASAGLREQSNSVHLENTLPQSTNVTHDGAQASNVPQRWSSSFTPIAVTPFSNPVGPTFTVGEDAGEIFNHFFTDSLIDHIVIQTNKYAQETMEPTKFLKWKSVTTEELRAYFGFMILMGLVRMPELEDYWKLDPVFNYPPIASRISRNRFKEISRFLHFADNQSLVNRGEPGFDRLGKVRPVIEEISKSLLHNYDVSRDVVVDEAMIPFKGRSYLKQYLPKKPVKWGIKAWCLADSHNGYVQKVDVYAGKTMGERKDWNMGEQVVLDLTYHLRGKYHHVYCDNFFTSSRLLEELLANGIYGCGTVRQNTKGYPAHLKMSGKGKRAQRKLGLINRGDMVAQQQGPLVSTVWLDTKPVTMMATNCQPGETSTVKRKASDGSKADVRNLGRRQSGHWPGDVAVLTTTWEEIVRALARRCGSTHRDLGRRQSGHWPGEVAVRTGAWGGDSQGTGQERLRYARGPGEETVRALARRGHSTYRDLGRRQSGHWPGDVAVLTGTWGGDSQGTGQERSQYLQGPGEETVRALARRCGSTHRDLGRRQSGHWPGDVAELTGTWGGDSQYAQGPGEETVRALARRCGRTHRDLGRRQPVRTGTWGGDSQGTGQKMWQNSQDLGMSKSGHWPGDVAVCM
eukprot:Em0007g1174a